MTLMDILSTIFLAIGMYFLGAGTVALTIEKIEAAGFSAPAVGMLMVGILLLALAIVGYFFMDK